jgi:hypothetical protein
MKTKKWQKINLILLFKILEQENGEIPKKKQWIEDVRTPSDMPIRQLFGNWTNFVIACGFKPRVPEISINARLNSIKSRTGKKGGNNKGGRYINNGYVLIWTGKKYEQEHRLVMSKKIGRPLTQFESVHHKNGNRSDNSEFNLELWSRYQPSGQRVIDKLNYAREIIRLYGNIYENPELIKQPKAYSNE